VNLDPLIKRAEPEGLTQVAAAELLAAEGYNELPTADRRGVWALALEIVRDPTFMLLLAAGAIYLLLGDFHEAVLLLSFVVMIAGLTVYQEHKTERALQALRDLTSPRALVVRDGQRMRIAGREVVRGEVLLLEEGDRVPADAVLLRANDVLVDESLLTGESVSVQKTAWDGALQMTRPGGDGLPFVYSGTLLTRGQALAEVLATGSRTEIGRIGVALSGAEAELTPLQQETARVIRRIAGVAIVLAAILVVMYGVTRGGWVDAVLAGITLAMAILPQEFPVVLTVFLALGAWRISKQRVLTRRIPAIETLGAATVLCVDKTGTLTMNRMTVRRLYSDGREHDMPRGAISPPPEFSDLVEYSVLASELDPFDPMEKAFRELADAAGSRSHAGWTIVKEYPLSSALLVHAHGWQPAEQNKFIVAAKGAPEAVFGLCRLAAEKRVQLDEAVARMADDGLRVLAVARGAFGGGDWPASLGAIEFTLLGLLGLADPVRPTVAAALAECYSAGMRVIMITGDYPGTARAIGRQIGLAGGGEVVTGAQLAGFDDAMLRNKVGSVNIFARVVPEQKLQLVKVLRENGEVVAMTGDGVNDAPALKAADIGIAMGGRGTDVARESASLVLLDDDFASIVHTARLGRRIYENIRNAMCYLMAVHVPIAGMSLLPLVFGWPLVFLPAHIVFLEFVINPACSVVFEAEEVDGDGMRRPPRARDEPLLGGWMLASSLLQGFSVLVAVAIVFGMNYSAGGGEAIARAMAFTTIVLGNLGLILANRSRSLLIVHTLRRFNRALWWIIGGTLAGVALVLYVPYLRSLFRFAPLSFADLLICIVASLLSLTWFEVYKLTHLRSTKVQSGS
jgi:Ca2+-transporting ATPase